jgi:hypothetical protein
MPLMYEDHIVPGGIRPLLQSSRLPGLLSRILLFSIRGIRSPFDDFLAQARERWLVVCSKPGNPVQLASLHASEDRQ